MDDFFDVGVAEKFDDLFLISKVGSSQVMKGTCPRGHASHALLTNPRCEILFEYGCRALIDGYPREAVSSFIAALERFYEFYIKLIVYKSELSFDDFDKTWKLTNLSERQLGAFAFSYLLYRREPVPQEFVKELGKWTEFRNGCIHAGIIPEWQKSYEYGEWVYNWIWKFVGTPVRGEQHPTSGGVVAEILHFEKKHPGLEYQQASFNGVLGFSSYDVEPFSVRFERLKSRLENSEPNSYQRRRA
jgi:hypothetical protein